MDLLDLTAMPKHSPLTLDGTHLRQQGLLEILISLKKEMLPVSVPFLEEFVMQIKGYLARLVTTVYGGLQPKLIVPRHGTEVLTTA